jgi:ribose transport system ATP-binding protein
MSADVVEGLGSERNSDASPSALRLRGLSKAFGATRALDDVNLAVAPGEIHGLVGRNGSGKSTLIKVLSGYHVPDSGTLEIGGNAVPLPLPAAEAYRHGLAFVHQDLGLLPDLSVMENIRIGRFTTGGGWRIKWKEERRLVAEALERFGVRVSPDTLVGGLREVDRALVAIVRGLVDLRAHQHGILVLDEPTAYLPRDSVEQLFTTVRNVANAGTAVIFVSHRLDEVMSLAHRTTVLRDGRVVGTLDTDTSSEEQLIELILGGELEDFYPEPSAPGTRVAVRIADLSGAVAESVSFDVHEGEILGLTGIAGAGYDEVPYLLFGAASARSGTVTIGSTTLDHAALTPKSTMDAGMALLPADRQNKSGVGELTLTQNVSLPVLGSFFTGGRLRQRAERSKVASLLTDYTVRPPIPEAKMNQLSGGNQQKALLAKWMQRTPPVLLLHEPTQGVDVGAKKDVFERLREATVAGAAVVFSSAEYEDLAHLCDRVLVFREGRIAATLSGADLTEERIVEQCYRADKPRSAA